MRITSKGQVTIPKEMRDRTGLLPGAEVEFTLDEDWSGFVRRHRAATTWSSICAGIVTSSR